MADYAELEELATKTAKVARGGKIGIYAAALQVARGKGWNEVETEKLAREITSTCGARGGRVRPSRAAAPLGKRAQAPLEKPKPVPRQSAWKPTRTDRIEAWRLAKSRGDDTYNDGDD